MRIIMSFCDGNVSLYLVVWVVIGFGVGVILGVLYEVGYCLRFRVFCIVFVKVLFLVLWFL